MQHATHMRKGQPARVKKQPVGQGLAFLRSVQRVSHHGVTQGQSVHPYLVETSDTARACRVYRADVPKYCAQADSSDLRITLGVITTTVVRFRHANIRHLTRSYS